MLLGGLQKRAKPGGEFDPLSDGNVRRVVSFASFVVGGAGAFITGFLLLLYGAGVGDWTTVLLACAGILSIPILFRFGLPPRAGAWIFVSVLLAACFYVALDPTDGVTSGLMVLLNVIILFAGATLGVRGLIAVGAIAILGVIGIAMLDLSRLPVIITHEAADTVVATAATLVFATLFSLAIVYKALGLYRDTMTELQRARDEARRVSEAKSSFLSQTSHEIRTPLNGMIGMAQLLGATDLTPAQRRYLDIMNESSRSLLTVLNDVLDLSKVEAGQLDIILGVADIRALTEAAAAPWRAEAERKGLTFDVAFAPDLPRKLRIDPVRVRQCLENLISNAVKFTTDGGITIAVVGRGAGEGHVLVAVVSDTGVGIAPEMMDRVFEPFQQVVEHGARAEGGTGLGMAIVRKLAERMGGGLSCESAAGRGSIFTLEVSAPVEAAESEPPAAEHPQATPRRLILIDPNPVARMEARAMLERAGHVVAEARDMGDALLKCEGQLFDAALIDASALVLDDRKLADQLYAALRLDRDRVFAICGLQDGQMVARAGLDAARAIRKPLEQTALLAAVGGVALAA